MIIQYYKKNVYGVEYIYILDKDIAKNIAVLTCRKTIDKRDIEALQCLGFEFKEVLKP